MLKAIQLYRDPIYGLVEHRVHKAARGYTYEFRCAGEVEFTSYTKRRLIADTEGSVSPWLFLDDTLIAVRHFTLSDEPAISCLYKTADGYKLRIWLDGLFVSQNDLTFARALRWLNEKTDQLERVTMID